MLTIPSCKVMYWTSSQWWMPSSKCISICFERMKLRRCILSIWSHLEKRLCSMLSYKCVICFSALRKTSMMFLITGLTFDIKKVLYGVSSSQCSFIRKVQIWSSMINIDHFSKVDWKSETKKTFRLLIWQTYKNRTKAFVDECYKLH